MTFKELIDGKEKVFNTTVNNPIHFRNDYLTLRGRDDELKTLRAFIDCDGEIRWLTVVGDGGSGKSKLVYAFNEEKDRNTAYKFVWLKSEDVEKILQLDAWNYDNYVTLVMVVDYAASCAGNLGKLLIKMQDSVNSPYKVRLIMIERAEPQKGSDARMLDPKWYTDFYAAGRDYLDTYRYGDGILHLEPLTEDTLKEIAKEYNERRIDKEKCRTLTDEELTDIVEKAKIIDKYHPSPRVLVVLLTADAVIGGNTGDIWDLDKLVLHFIKRFRKPWLNACGDDEELYKALCNMLVYATSVGGWALSPVGEPFKDSAEIIRSLPKSTRDALIAEINMNNTKNSLNPVEPDLVGEYFVLDYWYNNIDDEEKQVGNKTLNSLVSLCMDNLDGFTVFLDRAMENYANTPRFSAIFNNGLGLIADVCEGKDAEWFIGELLHLTYHQGTQGNAAGVKETADRMGRIHNAHPNHEEIAVQYARGLVNLTAAQKTAEERNDTIAELEKLYKEKRWEDSEEIAVRYARGLVNLTAVQKTAEERKDTIAKLKKLYEDKRWENSEEIAVQYAKGLVNLTNVQETSEEINDTIAELEKLYKEKRWENSEEIAELYARGLFNLTFAQEKADECGKTVAELKEVYGKWANSEVIAVRYARGLFNLTIEQETAEEINDTIAKLEKMYEDKRWENSEEIAVQYAKGLVNLTFAQKTAKERNDTIAELKKLYEDKRWENSEEIAVQYAKGLVNLIFALIGNDYPHNEIAAEFAKLTELHEKYPDNGIITEIYNLLFSLISQLQ